MLGRGIWWGGLGEVSGWGYRGGGLIGGCVWGRRIWGGDVGEGILEGFLSGRDVCRGEGG